MWQNLTEKGVVDKNNLSEVGYLMIRSILLPEYYNRFGYILRNPGSVCQFIRCYPVQIQFGEG